MAKALLGIIIVFGLLAGLILTLRSSARTGTPPKEVLDRASRRARELDAKERADDE